MEEAREDGTSTGVGRAGEPLAGEQEAAEAVLDGERIAVDAITGLELTFEVGRPDAVGRIERGGRPAGVWTSAAPAALLHEALAEEVLVQGLGRGQGPLGVEGAQMAENLASSPPRAMPTEREGRFEDLGVGSVRTGMRSV